ncbi:hypothetical protein AGABI2DRAFT_218018 [Agaricus bisporus var. bisporus H97]|uniref:hypothetical protein n=1 Tax=Agaricus bisporus var. bisporus (strain H97 / ATCC MYA-4626 / FGSC 10389) TaxID=936046 RepID=UPI00029F4F9A|nr:hypothetical protein AGABI2DRAFT_218018 [Agaricus bisporus var. bisporus H97]EKV49019.1 hypothetical protein AGABI2DRAFT_218018 [Agaricus bisporus var. bisporus H97]
MSLDSVDNDFQETLVPISTGISLELDLIKPRQPQEQESKLAICLHPWSRLGGRKSDPVLAFLAEVLLENNYHVVRYNSRGVGKSTGYASFTGFSEGEDLQALVRWALGQIENVNSVVFVGYSHGSLIGSLHPPLPTPIKTSHFLLSYPLGTRGWITLFRSSYYQAQLESLLKDERSNVLVVYGDQDEFTGVANYGDWVKKLQSAAQGSTRLCVSEIKNATHFWLGEIGDELGEVFRQWLP